MGVLGLLIQKILTDRFPLDVYGVYSILYAIINFSLMLFCVGLPSVVQRYVPEYMARAAYPNVRRLYTVSVTLVFFLALLPVAVLLAAHPPIARILHLPDLPLTLYGAVGLIILLGNLIVLSNGMLIGFSAFGPLTVGELSAACLRLGLIYTCSLFIPKLTPLFLVISIAYGFHLAFLWISVRSHLARLPQSSDAANLNTGEMSLYGLTRFFHSATAGILDYSFDIYMIAWLMSPGPGESNTAAAGLYGLASGLILAAVSFNPGRICFNVVKTTIFMKHDSTRDFNFVLWINRMYMKLLGFFYVPLVAGVAFLGHAFIGLIFKPVYLQSTHVFIIGTALQAAALTFIVPFYVVADVLKLKRIYLYERLFLIYNVALNFYLIPRYGILGAIVSTGTTWIWIAAFLYVYLRRLTPIQIDWLAFFKMILNALPMVLLFYASAPHIRSLPVLAIVAICGVCVYLVASHFNKILEADERHLLNTALKKSLIFF